MKNIVKWAMLVAAFCSPAAVVGQEPEAKADQVAPDQTAEGAPTVEAPAGPKAEVEAMRAKYAAIAAAYGEQPDLTSAQKSRLERSNAEVERRFKSLEEQIAKYEEAEYNAGAVFRKEFDFATIPSFERTKFVDENDAQLKKIVSLLGGKEADQVEGIILFEKLRESHQGLPRFKDAAPLYVKCVTRLERKWRLSKERLERDRQKMNTNARNKATEVEDSQYSRLEQKLSAAGKDISRDWFVPGKYIGNVRVLDRLIQRASNSLQSQFNTPVAEAGTLPDLLNAYWVKIDEAVQCLMVGNAEQAMQMVDSNDAYNALMALPHCCIPDDLKNDIRKQHQEVKTEIRNRSLESGRKERDKSYARSAIDRDLSAIERTVERLTDDLEAIKEEAARKAEEEAERKAEEEAAAAAEAEEAAAAENDEEDTPKPAKKKKSKKRSAKSDKE